jgi:4-hydroxy-tetrahydrodipicolinate synthase
MSSVEKMTLLDCLAEAGVETARMMPGTGCCALSDTVQLTSHAVSLGCAGTLMLPPFFYKGVSDDGLFAYYSEVIQAVASDELKIYLYHIPPFSLVPLSVALVDRLVSAYPNTVVGIKDSSGDWNNTLAYNQQQWPDFRVFCGSESFLLQNLQHGGAGCISATANVNAAAIQRLCDNWQTPQADSLQAELNPIRNIFQFFSMIAALKAATSLYAGDPEWLRVRPPLLPLDNQQLDQLQAQLSAANFQMQGLQAA